MGESEMGRNKLNGSTEKQIASINSDYVRLIESQQKRSKEKKIRLYRRLAVFGISSFAIIGFLISTLISTHTTLAEKKEEQVLVEQELSKVLEEQEMLNLEITKLNDDEYIGKLLRKDYFLSEEGEIIFSLPEINGE